MKRFLLALVFSLLPLCGCKPAAQTSNQGGEEQAPTTISSNGGGEIAPEDLPQDPARDLSDEQKQVAAMDVAALVEALANDKLYLVAVDELATRGPEAVGPLTVALGNKNENVRQSAMLALGMLGPAAQTALPQLKAIAEDKDQPEVISATAANAVDAIAGN